MNWTGKITEFFVAKGKLTFLLMIALFVWGILSFFQTTKKYNPTIVAPAFQIVVDYPGASRVEIEEQITKPLENVINDIPGVEDIYSVTVRGGRAIINVNFFVGEDLNAAKIALNDRIQTDMNLAPLGIQPPSIQSVDPEDVPIVVVALRSKKYSDVELREFAYEMKEQLSTVAGTSRLSIVGGRKKEVLVEILPEKLKEFGIGVHHIEQALQQNNLFLPAGQIKGQNAYTPLEALGWVQNTDEIKEIIVISNDTVDLRLKDIATVKETKEEIEDYVRHTRKSDRESNSVLISIAKIKGQNISDVSDAIANEVESLKKGFIPNGVEAEVVINDGDTAKDEINGLLSNLITSIAIVVAVLFIFLNMKAALLVAIAIPLTLASVFGVAFLADQSINRITLFALILSLGMLVDNATVVIENIVRKVSEVRKTTDMTFIDAVNEVGPGLFMSTVTTVLAFIPMAFISGMMGPYMGPIPFFVPAALIIALLISYTINPWMASVFFAKGEAEEHDENRGKAHKSKLNQMGTHLLMSYRNGLRHILQSRKKSWMVLGGVVIALILSASLPALYLVKFRMLPKADVDQFFVYVDLPAGSPLEKTYEVTTALENKIYGYKQVEMIQSYVSHPPVIDFNGLFKGVSSRNQFHQATMRIGILPDDKRDITSEQLVLKMRPELNNFLKEKFSNLDIKLKLIEDPPGPPVLSTLLVRIQGFDEKRIMEEAKKLMPEIAKVEGVVDLDMSLSVDTKTLQVVVDHYAASKAKVTPAQIVGTLNSLYSGKVLGIFHQQNNAEQELIKLRFSKDVRLDASTLEAITIPNPMRISIPLSKLVKVQEVETQKPLYKENHIPTVYIYGEMGDRSITYAGIDILTKLYDYKLANGKGAKDKFSLYGIDYKTEDMKDVRISLGGEWELTLDVFRDLMIAMAMAVLVIYLVLVAQFESFSDPLIIMSTIPLGVIGVMPGFMILNVINGEYFTATSMIGVIALAGIAVNNSIILLEYLNSLRGKQIPMVEALVEACGTRLRPIALTTVTTMLGSMTILDDPVWSGLAWAIILGLGMSSALILIVFPALYAIVREKEWNKHHK